MLRVVTIAVLLYALAVGTAAAERVGVVTVRGPHAPVSPAAVRDALAAALGPEALIDPFAEARGNLNAGAVPADTLGAFRRARELLDEGWRGYLQADPEFADTRLVAARLVALEVAGLPGGTELLAEISLRMGAARLELGRTGDAALDFRLTRALWPARTATDAEFKPEVAEAFARAGAQVAREVRELRVEPASAEVVIDGRAVGRGAARHSLARGLHLIVARAPGFETRALLVLVSADSPATIDLLLLEDGASAAVVRGPASLSVGTGEQSAGRTVAGLMQYAELDALVVAAPIWRRGAPALLGQRCAGVPVRCSAVFEIGFARPADLPAAAARLLTAIRGAVDSHPSTLLVDARLVDGEAPGGQRPGGDPASPWWHSPWLWGGASASVIAVAAALLLSRDRNVELRVAGDRCDFLACAQ